MKRIILAAVSLLATILTIVLPATAASAKPNILVFLVDDMGLMDSSVPFLTDGNGKPERHPLNDFYQTPNMLRLAEQGVRFSNFYAMSVCSPTRVSIMTGQTSARHHTTQFIKPESNNAGAYGAADWQWEGISKTHVTLSRLMRQAGYRTIHAGKAHFGPVGSFGEKPENFGFDVNIAGCAYGQPGSYYGIDSFGHAKKGREKRAVPGLDKYHGQDIYLTEALTLEMNAAITEAVAAKKPFLAYMSHYAVHAPFQSDARFAGNYTDHNKRQAAFATMIEGMDKSLGDMLDHLEKLGVAEDTIVLFLGDNGTDAPIGPTHEIACSAPLRGKKGTHYEGGMRVPFIAAWAKPQTKNRFQKKTPIQANSISGSLGAVYDLFPTLLSFAGAKSPAKHPVDGINLRPLLSGKAGEPDREFLMHFPHSHRSSYFTAYRKGDWKLVYHYRSDGKIKWPLTELFDLANDPYEASNLSVAQPKKLREMMAAMTASLQKAGAQYPLADDKKTLLKPTLN